MSLDIIERHNPAVFEFLWCPVCGHEVFAHIPFEGVFCETCNTTVELREPIEDRGYAEALIACFDTGSTWNLHIEGNSVATSPPGQHGPRSSARRATTNSTGGVLDLVRAGSPSDGESSTTWPNPKACHISHKLAYYCPPNGEEVPNSPRYN